jgi:putative redox protein
MTARPIRATFEGASGAELAARIDLPAGPVVAYALFAHCFTCSKDIVAARTIATALTNAGIAVLRFDFTGLGESGGDFASTNFTMNLADLKRAARFLEESYGRVDLLIGHSLGGAAVIAAARDLPGVKAVATINAPSDVNHVTRQFADRYDDILEKGSAQVTLGDRPFRIEKQFLDDLEQHRVTEAAAELGAALLVMHAPRDAVVGIENASALFTAAKHPKSFVSLAEADHLLMNREDASYAANVIAAWVSRYVGIEGGLAQPAETEDDVLVTETALGKFQNLVRTGPHHLIADEPTSFGGLGSGPSPYDLLCAALGTCTTMTLRLYADRKQLALDRVTCRVHHEKVHLADADESMDNVPKPDRFTRRLRLEGELTDDQRRRLIEIAERCPVHRTLEAGAVVVTEEDQE